MDESVRAFYDELADHYHLIFADWWESMRRQANALDRLLADALGAGPHAILDCACGIGTQAIGLARLGHRVHATDLSPAAVARAEREAKALGVPLSCGVADLRSLTTAVTGEFDVVLACDNALPHLMDDVDLDRAVTNMASMLRPSGLLLASIRDYDGMVREGIRTEGPRVFDAPEGRRISFQVWDWADDGRHYRLQQFIVRQVGASWHTNVFATRYRALLREELEAALRHVGLTNVRWHESEASGFFQPIVTARKP
jgi:glycine/sarcosine N-methyltransferase